MTDIHGSFTFMQVKSEMFDFPPAGLFPFYNCLSFRTLFWTANSRPPRASQGEGDHRFSLLQVTNHKVCADCELISLGASCFTLAMQNMSAVVYQHAYVQQKTARVDIFTQGSKFV